MHIKEYTLSLGTETLKVQFNDLANQANGSCMVSLGNTTVLATAVMTENVKQGSDFFPLTVDYEEKFYASGKILGSQYNHREGRPTDEAILNGRIVDRTIRPLFEQYIRNEIQVVITVLSFDEHDPAMLAVIAASVALGTSDIPWNGPVSAIRILKTKSNSELVINPTQTQRKESSVDLDMIACGKDGLINMIEIAGFEASEKDMVLALQKASSLIEKIQVFQKQIIAEIGKEKKTIAAPIVPEEITKLFSENIAPTFIDMIFGGPSKQKILDIQNLWASLVQQKISKEFQSRALAFLDEKINDLVHTEAIKNKRRADGRGVDEIRPLFIQAGGVSAVLHGSGIFFRGETHVLGVLTLGSPKNAQLFDDMEGQSEKSFMVHYNFPPFSTGAVGKVGTPNRRMIGHGALTEKALAPMIPSKDIFPYTIRIVAEALASNGSTSMASVCAGTVALMDGGVPITRPVAGISIGLMMKSPTEYVTLTDIQGPEDHYGDMDFKVAGTRTGITAVQMDVKVAGVPIAILAEGFTKAHAARIKILDEIQKIIAAPRPSISSRAPKILSFKIKPEQIGEVIGPGGKTIHSISQKTLAQINIEEDGTIIITGTHEATEKAKDYIESITHEYRKGERFTGEVTKIVEFGAFVRINPNTEGLVHISEIAPFRIDTVSKYIHEGQQVPVIIKDIDEKKRISLSIKSADPDFIKPTTSHNGTK